MYGFYFVNGSQNDYAGNSLLGNGAPEYPTPPSLTVTSPADESTVNGTVMISWNESGESLSYTTVTIDGVPNTATGSSFSWNTASLSDGEHTIVVNVTDTGGFSASQSIYLFTDNQLLATQATISRLNQTLTSNIASGASLNSTLQSLRSQVSSLESQLSSLNATLHSTQANVNGLRGDQYIVVAVLIAAGIAAAVALMLRRRQRTVPRSEASTVTQGS
jgi:hypothetical protein